MSTEYFIVLGVVGVAFFAVSGALLGHDKSINGFGIVVVGIGISCWLKGDENIIAL